MVKIKEEVLIKVIILIFLVAGAVCAVLQHKFWWTAIFMIMAMLSPLIITACTKSEKN